MNNLNEVSSNLFDLLFLLNRKVFNHSEFIKGLPLAPSHVKVIFHLMNSESLSVSQIAQKLNISKPNMTPIIDKLIHDGYVNRFEDPNDRRVLRIKVTEKSKILFREQRHIVKSKLQEKISHLSSDDLDALNTSINVISDIVSKLPKENA